MDHGISYQTSLSPPSIIGKIIFDGPPKRYNLQSIEGDIVSIFRIARHLTAATLLVVVALQTTVASFLGASSSRVMSFDNGMTASSITTSHDANNNTRTSNTTTDDIINASNPTAQSCRRRLFCDDIDPQEQQRSNLEYFQANLSKIRDEASQKYNFDFLHGKPHPRKKGQKFTWLLPDDELPMTSTNSSTTISSTTVISTTQNKPIVVQKKQQLLINQLSVVSRAPSHGLKRRSSAVDSSNTSTSSCESSSKRAKSV